MSVKMRQGGSEQRRNRKAAPANRRAFLAKSVIFIERVSPILIIAGGPVLLLVAISLFGGWNAIPAWAHAIALIAAVSLSALLARRHWRPDLLPRRVEALERLERDGGVRHDALRALEDRPAGLAGPLWDAHQAEMKLEASAARLSPPNATANSVDPNGFRYAAFALLVVGLIYAGPDTPGRLLAGFSPGAYSARGTGLAELWIEPPAYTGKAPIYLLKGNEPLSGRRAEFEAPQGSVVHAQINPGSRAVLKLKAQPHSIRAKRNGPEKSGRLSLTLMQDGTLILNAQQRSGRWPVKIIKDLPPAAEFIEAPSASDDGRINISVALKDDYGIAAASLRMRLVTDQERPADAPRLSDDALGETRLMEIDGAAGPPGARNFVLDLQAEPWAGLKVIGAIVVTDAAGQVGETAPIEIALPAKRFFNPVAKAVIEQRQTLAVAPDEWRRAEWALSGITLGPEFFFDNMSDYLLLRTAMWRVSKEAGGDYKDTVDDFWPLALQLEDEALELARRRLEAAKAALKNALEEGAPDEEIERLTEEMRAALQQYLQALAQSGRQLAEDDRPPDEVVNSADLDSMLDAIRDLAKSGAANAARQALADLENLLNNLRMSGRGRSGSGEAGAGQPGDGEQGGAAGQAGDLIGRQRELADKSFERGRRRGAVGDDLGDEQRGLAGDLSDLMKDLEGAGERPDPEGKAARALGQALSAMRRSEEALRAEEFDNANEAMDRAIASLREGAENIAKARAAAARNTPGSDGGGATPMRDPLGRPIGDAYGRNVDVPEKSNAQKTRELLEELRRRLSEGERAKEEIDYLERLLERF
jgi:uncharacterized protein (TIGR02302 family)